MLNKGFNTFEELKEHLVTVLIGQGDRDLADVSSIEGCESPEQLYEWLKKDVENEEGQAFELLVEAITSEFWTTWGRPESTGDRKC